MYEEKEKFTNFAQFAQDVNPIATRMKLVCILIPYDINKTLTNATH